MTERFVVPVPVAAGAEALNEDERHARLDETACRQAIGGVPRRAVAVEDLGRLAGQVEGRSGFHEAPGAGEALLVTQDVFGVPLLEELLAQHLAKGGAGLKAVCADAFGPGGDAPYLAVARELHHVEPGIEAASTLKCSVVPRGGQVDVARQPGVILAELASHDRPEAGPLHAATALLVVACSRWGR